MFVIYSRTQRCENLQPVEHSESRSQLGIAKLSRSCRSSQPAPYCQPKLLIVRGRSCVSGEFREPCADELCVDNGLGYGKTADQKKMFIVTSNILQSASSR